MKARVREKDWSRTPLGPIEGWSPVLRATTATLLDSPLPTILYWGAERVAIYNDAYALLLGGGGDALGRRFDEVWTDSLALFGPLVDRAFTGEASSLDEAPIVLERDGRTEQGWFDHSFGPLRDEAGTVVGVLDICVEATRHVRSRRRQAFLLEIGDALAGQSAPRDVMQTAAAMLRRHLGASRVHYGEVEPDGTALVYGDAREGVATITGRHRIRDYGAALLAEFRAGRTVVQTDVEGISPEERAALEAIDVVAFVAVPIVRSGRLVSLIAVHHSAPRQWRPDEIQLVEEIARLTSDAVERARAEDALRQSEERYRTLFHSIDQGFCVFDMIFDAQGRPVDYRWVEINPVFERQTGLRDPIGRTARELVPDLDESWFRIYGEVAVTGTSVRFENYAPAMGRWFDVFAFRVGGPESRRVALLFKDITASRRAEEAVRRSEQRLQLALDAAKLGTWEWDIPTDTCRWSPRVFEITGLDPSEFTGSGDVMRALVHPDDRAAAAEAEAAMHAGASFSAEYRICRPDGAARWIAMFGRADASEVPRMVGTISDITDRKRIEEALRENDRRKDEFLATLAHELRNPLAPIRNGLQILRLSGGGGPRAERVQEMMERQAGHMIRLVDDLLEVSRITRGKIDLRTERIDLATVVHTAVETSTPQIERAGHQLTVRFPPEPLIVHGDPVRLAQVFANLLDNAAKYTDPGGAIRVEAHRLGSEVHVEVTDTGVGIPPEVLPHVFDMFTQADRSESRARGGLGIGLTLVRSLVEMHGGTVEASSEGPGRGTTMCVRLPLAADMSEEPSHDGGGADSLRAGLRVLVVDDNADAADSLADVLELLGADVHVVYDGASGLEAVCRFRPEVVLLDLGMPGMDGYEVARRIRADPEAPPTVLVALTGWGQEEDRRRSREAGFDHHLVKPVSLETLEALLRSFDPAPAADG